MPTLINTGELRELFAHDIAQISDTQLGFCLRGAARTLQKWVGLDAYEDALEGEDAEDAPRAEALKDAEAYLGAAELLLLSGVRIRAAGLVKREQDAAGPLGGNITNEYLSPKEIKELRESYQAQAEAAAAPYRQRETGGVGSGAGTFTLAGGWRN